MSDKIDMIYDLLKQDREEASDFRNEVRESHKSTGKRLTSLEVQSQTQNQQLKEHISGVNTLKDLHKQNADRINNNEVKIVELEKPRVVFKTLKKWIIGAGAIAGSTIAIAKLLGLF